MRMRNARFALAIKNLRRRSSGAVGDDKWARQAVGIATARAQAVASGVAARRTRGQPGMLGAAGVAQPPSHCTLPAQARAQVEDRAATVRRLQSSAAAGPLPGVPQLGGHLPARADGSGPIPAAAAARRAARAGTRPPGSLRRGTGSADWAH